MSNIKNARWLVKSYPKDEVTADNFELVYEQISEPKDGEVLVKTTSLVISPPLRMAIGTGGINQARIAKAWAEFDGSGLTLNASYNVSSVTDHGNRDYTINFGTAMADTNYSIVGSNIGQTASYNWSVVTGMGTAKTTSAARINVPHINDSSLYGNDPDAVNVIAFGN